MKPIIIFDLDGTLSLADHRQHLLKDETKTEAERWKAFYKASADDLPNEPILTIFRRMLLYPATAPELWVWSGRSDEVRLSTMLWLAQHTSMLPSAIKASLRMRKSGDHTPDHELKQRWLNKLSEEDRSRIILAFEDRARVVEMWRKNGITCAQVAPGEL